MSEVKWTNSQLEAIEYKGSSIIVSAAAGSGKTAVLVERIIRLIASTDIDRLLIVTFTNAAAAQMREGITKAIEKKLSQHLSTEVAKHYHKQLMLLPGAFITTMHSFCSKIVRDNFDKLDLAPDFGIGDTALLDLLLEESLNELLEQKYEQDDKNFINFADCYSSSKNDNTLSDLIKRLHNFIKAVPYPKKWLDETKEIYNCEDIDNADWMYEILLSASDEMNALEDIISKTQGYINENPILSFAQEMINQDLQIIKNFKCSNYSEGYNYIQNINFTKFTKPKGMSKLEEVVDLDKIRKTFKDGIKEITEKYFEFSPQEIVEVLAKQKNHIHTLCDLVAGLDIIYKSKKSERNIVDFNDLEHYAIELLTDENGNPSDIACSLSQEFDEIIVDEYQDTNTVQETIFNAISKNKSNIFMVGDMKQSIYRFRNTAPELFLRKVETFKDFDNPDGKRIFLSNNFRSRATVLDFTNLIFSQIMSRRSGEVDYSDKEMLYQGAEYPGKDDSCEVILLDNKDEIYIDGEAVTPIDKEASVIAYKIHKMIEDKTEVFDKKTQKMRPAKYKDFTILLRNSKNISDNLSQCLQKYGIPVYNDNSGEAILSSYETQNIISFLKIIDNPYQDIPLAAVLRSPLFGFSDDLLAQIRCTLKDDYFFNALKAFNDEKTAEFIQQLNYWRQKAVYTPISTLIHEILAKTNYLEYTLAMTGGKQRVANIRFLIQTASSFESSSFKGLFNFLSYLDKFSPTGSSITAPKTLPETTNVVNITTIHKSKGIEYPIVIIPQLGKNFSNNDLKNKMLMHKSLGVGFDYTNPNENIKILSPLRQAISHKITAESLSEELRVLYVALTRAREKLILIGSVRDMDKFLDKIKPASQIKTEKLPSHMILGAKSYLEWVCLALLRHKSFYDLRAKFQISSCQIDKQANVKISILDEMFEHPLPNIDEEIPLCETTNISDEIKSRLEYKYPNNINIFSKYSVTELKKMMTEDENSKKYFEPLTPLIKPEVSLDITPPQKGSLVHFIMEKLDFQNCDVDNLLQTLKEKGQITDEEIKVIPVDKIIKFCQSDLGQRIKNSSELYREVPFNIHIDSSFINPALIGTKVQLQGVIDCYFKENDTYNIIDYKTDKITDNNIKSKISDYSKQIEFYKYALKIMYPGFKSKGYLYFFDKDLTIPV